METDGDGISGAGDSGGVDGDNNGGRSECGATTGRCGSRSGVIVDGRAAAKPAAQAEKSTAKAVEPVDEVKSK